MRNKYIILVGLLLIGIIFISGCMQQRTYETTIVQHPNSLTYAQHACENFCNANDPDIDIVGTKIRPNSELDQCSDKECMCRCIIG